MPDDLAWETLDERVAYTCPGFDVVNQNVRLPDDTETDFDYLSEPPSVVVLPFTDDRSTPLADRELVVIEEWRQAVDRVNRGLPAGGVEPGDDDPAAAARRELTEETGYVTDDVEHLTTAEPLNGAADAVHHYFVAFDCDPDGDQRLDFNESIRVDTTTFGECYEAVLAGDVRDGRTALGILRYAAEEAGLVSEKKRNE